VKKGTRSFGSEGLSLSSLSCKKTSTWLESEERKREMKPIQWQRPPHGIHDKIDLSVWIRANFKGSPVHLVDARSEVRRVAPEGDSELLEELVHARQQGLRGGGRGLNAWATRVPAHEGPTATRTSGEGRRSIERIFITGHSGARPRKANQRQWPHHHPRVHLTRPQRWR
jgi:hypothetical protein